MIEFSLSYTGDDADDHQLNFYDASKALAGFQRSLALTTHLILNGEVITKAPYLQGAEIMVLPPEEGSWLVRACIVIGTLSSSAYLLGSTPKDTVLGHLMYSAYDYVISESLGFHVDFDKSLGQQYKEINKQETQRVPIIEQSKLDSVIEKCEHSIKEMHRPIIKSHSANSAKIYYTSHSGQKPLQSPLNSNTFEYIQHTDQSNTSIIVEGKISSYNINTFSGRIYVPELNRPISFQLSDAAQNLIAINKVTSNMRMNARDRFTRDGSDLLQLEVLENFSRSGRLKSYYVLAVN